MRRTRWKQDRPRKFTWFGFVVFMAAMFVIAQDIVRDTWSRTP
jgi:hypothetical protein